MGPNNHQHPHHQQQRSRTSNHSASMPSLSSGLVCEQPPSTAAAVQQALRDSLTASAPAAAGNGLDSLLHASAKRSELLKIEFDRAPANLHKANADALMAKYEVLQPTPNVPGGAADGTTSNGSNGTPSGKNGVASTPEGKRTNGQNGKQPNSQLPAPKRVLYARESLQIGWQLEHWQTGMGMVNFGNTCYLNSTLQALFHVPSFAQWLLSDSEHRRQCNSQNDQKTCIICSMAVTLLDTQQSPSGCARPFRVYNKLGQICRHLMIGRQEDAHEFLRYLVEAMEKSYLLRFHGSKDFDQFTKETTPLNQILGGYMRTSVRCLACNHDSVTFQHFQDLLLDIRKSSTIDEALDTHFGRERLEDMGYKCEWCKKKVSATKQFSLERAPIALCIQIKRFSMSGNKINKHVAFGTRLNLSRYSSRRAVLGGNDPEMQYRLVSMVTHLGSSQHCGHYTAVGLSASNGSYYTFDDSSVRPISAPNLQQTNAYIMFYELDNPQAVRNASAASAAAQLAPQAELPRLPPQAVQIGNKRLMPLMKKPPQIGPVLPPEMQCKRPAQSDGESDSSDEDSDEPSPKRHDFDQQTSPKVLKISMMDSAPRPWQSNGVTPQKLHNGSGLTPLAEKKLKLTDIGTPVQASSESGSLRTPTLPSHPKKSDKKSAANGTPSAPSAVGGKPLVPQPTPPSSPEMAPRVINSATVKPTSNGAKRINGHASLVPYEAHSSEEDDDDDEDDDDEDMTCDPDKTPPKVMTAAGLFQVTSATTSKPPKPKPSYVALPARRVDDSAGVPPSPSVASHLERFSHQGYGNGTIKTWKGQTSNMDQEIKEDRLAELRRRQEIDVDAEMDAGRQKKVKSAVVSMAGSSNPGYNAFQGVQDGINSGTHRWTSGAKLGRPYGYKKRSNGHHHNGGNHNQRQQHHHSNYHNGQQQHHNGGGNNGRARHLAPATSRD